MSSTTPATATTKNNKEENSRKRKCTDESPEKILDLIEVAMRTLSDGQAREADILRLKKQRADREVIEEERRKIMHIEDLKSKKWTAFYESLKYTDEFSQRRTRKLKEELEELEGI